MNNEHTQQEQPPEAIIESRPRFRLSLIWVIPLIAALAAISLGIKHYVETGPTITIQFNDAEGLQAGKTEVKYKNVVIGKVNRINISDDNQSVLVRVTLNGDASRFARKGTRFWVVRPRVGLRGISGLSTLLSGPYIGANLGKSNNKKLHFKGLEKPPALTHNLPGTTFTLISDSLGSLSIGSPVYYRKIKVGHVLDTSLSDNGESVSLNIFINAPYDQFVRQDTRFWNASGLNLSVSSRGLKVNTESLATVLAGGIAFRSRPHDKHDLRAPAHMIFTLYDTKSDAMEPPHGPGYTLSMQFKHAQKGLATGSPVLFRGVEFGHVTSVSLAYDPKTHTFPVHVEVEVHPKRLGKIYKKIQKLNSGKGEKLMRILVKNGLRAQARISNLFTQQRYIALDFIPNAKPVHFDPSKRPVEIPTAPGGLSEIKSRVADILTKIDKLPLKQLGNNMNTTIKRTNKTLKNLNSQVLPQVQTDLKAAETVLGAINGNLSQGSPLRRNVHKTLQQVDDAARSLQSLSNYLSRNPSSVILGKPDDPSPEYRGGPLEPNK